MQKFVKKTVEIEAVQTPGKDLSVDNTVEENMESLTIATNILRWMDENNYPTAEKGSDLDSYIWFNEDGDWIIKGIKGEFYPCKPDIFESSYEAV